MTNKTCGECKHLEFDPVASTCKKKLWICADSTPACYNFEPKKPTNGDKIIAGGNKALLKFHSLSHCAICIYYNEDHRNHKGVCLSPKDKTCEEGIEAWLNAPAESGMENEEAIFQTEEKGEVE